MQIKSRVYVELISLKFAVNWTTGSTPSDEIVPWQTLMSLCGINVNFVWLDFTFHDFRFQFFECARVSLYIILGQDCSLWMIASSQIIGYWIKIFSTIKQLWKWVRFFRLCCLSALSNFARPSNVLTFHYFISLILLTLNVKASLVARISHLDV